MSRHASGRDRTGRGDRDCAAGTSRIGIACGAGDLSARFRRSRPARRRGGWPYGGAAAGQASPSHSPCASRAGACSSMGSPERLLVAAGCCGRRRRCHRLCDSRRCDGLGDDTCARSELLLVLYQCLAHQRLLGRLPTVSGPGWRQASSRDDFSPEISAATLGWHGLHNTLDAFGRRDACPAQFESGQENREQA